MFTKNISLSILSLGVGLSLAACGGGGGGGGAAPSIDGQGMFKKDMQALSNSSITTMSKANGTISDSYTKVFGTPSGASVKAFIQERVKHVFATNEIESFAVEMSVRGQVVGTDNMARIFGVTPTNTDGPGFVTGVNYSAISEPHYSRPDVTVTVKTSAGNVVADNYRVGLVGLTPTYAQVPHVTHMYNPKTKGYDTIRTLKNVPLEGRVAVLVHEGRHSDCPNGPADRATCGYGHARCPAGHDLAGADACDGVAWGAYAMGFIYTLSTLDNYPVNTEEDDMLEADAIDLAGRISSQAVNEMKATDPNLTSL